MPLDQDTITQQLALLAQYRRTLAHLLQQAAQYGGEVFAPPQTINGIAEARAEIQRIKAGLREGGVEVADEPNDDAPPATSATQGGQPAAVGPRVQSTLNVTDNKGTAIGVQNIFNQPSLAPALHQLRAPVGDFVGREREIDQLVQALSKAVTGGAAAAISGVRGMGGIGKTELAYAAAQQLSARFPDAQLLVELHGAGTNPLSPAQALQTVIRAFEREAKLPDDLDQLQALYRDKLTTKRTLILADDAKDAAQVRPLLPPVGCALLVTSRNRFSVPGMAALDLGTLPPEEAERLLLSICPRIGEQAAKLAKLCGYLPLALQVSAGLLANSTRSVEHYLEQLEAERLKHLSDPDDPAASVEASLRLSYDALEGAAQTALAQISVFATSFDLPAALAVLEIEGDVEALVELLVRRSLLEWDEQLQRYSLHELVRAFAAAWLGDADSVWLRYAWHYARVADLAENLYDQGGALLSAALALFDRERTHIDAGWGWALAHAAKQEADALLMVFANATAYIGDLRYDKRWKRIPQIDAALEAAKRLGQKRYQGIFLGNLGNAYADLGDAHQAIDFYQQHLALAREIGDRRAEGTILSNLGLAYADLGDAHQASDFYQQALVIVREIGDRRGEGNALGNLGLAHAALGDVRQAITFHEQHLVIAGEIGDRRGEGAALGNLGIAYYALGDAHKAIDFLQQHLTVAREIGERRGEGNALGNLGLAYAALGDLPKAIDFYEQQLVIVREIGDRRGEGNALGNLGSVYYKLGDVRQAITFYEQYLAIARQIGDRRGEGNALGNLGLAYAALGDLPKAIDFYEQQLVIVREIGDRRGEGTALGNLGVAYADLGDARKAIEFHEQALLIVREIGDRRAEAIASWNLGLALEKEGHPAQAVVAMQVCVEFKREIGHLDAEKDAAQLEQVRQRLADGDSAPVTGEQE